MIASIPPCGVCKLPDGLAVEYVSSRVEVLPTSVPLWHYGWYTVKDGPYIMGSADGHVCSGVEDYHSNDGGPVVYRGVGLDRSAGANQGVDSPVLDDGGSRGSTRG
jgi:hypothetical protein